MLNIPLKPKEQQERRGIARFEQVTFRSNSATTNLEVCLLSFFHVANVNLPCPVLKNNFILVVSLLNKTWMIFYVLLLLCYV